MEPLATLVLALGALLVLDLAARELGGSRRPRPRTRGGRPAGRSPAGPAPARPVALVLPEPARDS